MVNISRKLVLFMVGLALLLPLSNSAFAEPERNYGPGQYNFYIGWMSPRVEPMESNAIVLEYKARSIELEDILPSISTISSNDKKIVGVVLPPFVYFSKKF